MFAQLKARMKALGVSLNVTKYAVSLGSANATTGLYAISYDGGSTIEMPIFTLASQKMLTGMGLYVKTDALGLTSSSVALFDKIKLTISGTDYYYRVVAIRPHPWGDSIAFYEVDLQYLELHE